jgi:shikimate dehydrogenase
VDNLIIANRTIEKAIELKTDLVEKLEHEVRVSGLDENLTQELKDTDILINTTPVGMYPKVDQKPFVDATMMHQDLVVNDIVYNPLKTGLLKEADKAGAKSISGIKMLIYQGIEAFKIWTGIEPPVEIFQNALMNELDLDEL